MFIISPTRSSIGPKPAGVPGNANIDDKAYGFLLSLLGFPGSCHSPPMGPHTSNKKLQKKTYEFHAIYISRLNDFIPLCSSNF